MGKVLVTGGSGFIGSHAILQLVEQGHAVRATVRSLGKVDALKATLARRSAAPALGAVEYVAARLESDDGWAEAAAGCDYVLHIASPFPATVPRNESELIGPAKDGALRVLRASRDAGARRVVLTSSFAAIGYGHPDRTTPYDETCWTDPSQPDVLAYAKSKTLAERAAWDFIAAEGGQMELSVVNPVGVFGPVLGPDYSSSILIVQRLLDGAVPGCPRLSFGAVDVRDVVDLHLRAMLDPAASGERFLAVAGDFLSFAQIAGILKARLGSEARRVPTRQIPDWAVRLFARIDPAAKQILPELGRAKNATARKAIERLGWSPRSAGDAIAATARSLIDQGLVKA